MLLGAVSNLRPYFLIFLEWEFVVGGKVKIESVDFVTTHTLYVDPESVEYRGELGSALRPFISLTDAVNFCNSLSIDNVNFVLAPGDYNSEDATIVLPLNSCLTGSSSDLVTLNTKLVVRTLGTASLFSLAVTGGIDLGESDATETIVIPSSGDYFTTSVSNPYLVYDLNGSPANQDWYRVGLQNTDRYYFRNGDYGADGIVSGLTEIAQNDGNVFLSKDVCTLSLLNCVISGNSLFKGKSVTVLNSKFNGVVEHTAGDIFCMVGSFVDDSAVPYHAHSIARWLNFDKTSFVREGEGVSALVEDWVVYARATNTTFFRTGSGSVIEFNNHNSSSSLNQFINCVASGDVLCNASHTLMVAPTVSGSITGSNIVLQSSDDVRNDSSVGGSTLTEALDSLNDLKIEIGSLSGKNGLLSPFDEGNITIDHTVYSHVFTVNTTERTITLPTLVNSTLGSGFYKSFLISHREGGTADLVIEVHGDDVGNGVNITSSDTEDGTSFILPAGASVLITGYETTEYDEIEEENYQQFRWNRVMVGSSSGAPAESNNNRKVILVSNADHECDTTDEVVVVNTGSTDRLVLLPSPAEAIVSGKSRVITVNKLSGTGDVLLSTSSTNAGIQNPDGYKHRRVTGKLSVALAPDGPEGLDEFGPVRGVDTENASSYFGKSSCVSSTGVMVVGDPMYYDDDITSESGAVFVYSRTTGIWVQTQVIKPGVAGEGFGNSVAISSDGQVLAVGSYHPINGGIQGDVYIYRLDAGTYVYDEVLNDDANLSINDQFGNSISLSDTGEYLVIGAVAANSGFGKAYVYHYNSVNEEYDLEDEIVGSDVAAAVSFGKSVAISSQGLWIAAGAPGFNGSDGKVYIFERDTPNHTYTEVEDIAGVASIASSFGYSVDISEDSNLLLIGAPTYGPVEAASGIAYLYEFDTTWGEIDTMESSTIVPNERFGLSVSLGKSGEWIAVGTKRYTISEADDNVQSSIQIFYNENGVVGPVAVYTREVSNDPNVHLAIGNNVYVSRSNPPAFCSSGYVSTGNGMFGTAVLLEFHGERPIWVEV